MDGNGASNTGAAGGMDVEMEIQEGQAQTSAVPDYFNRSIAPLPGAATGEATATRRTSTYSLCGNNTNPNITTMSLPSTPATTNDPPYDGSGMQIDGQMFTVQQQRMLKESGIGVQAFSTDLQPPPTRVGLMQPFVHSQDGAGGMVTDGVAGEVMKARSAHGYAHFPSNTSCDVLTVYYQFFRRPHCKTIPRLVLSDHPDPNTGKRSMWTMCSNCGSVEMVQS